MDIKRMLQTARTSDLYDVIAEALNVLVERDNTLTADITTIYAGVATDGEGERITFVYYDEQCMTDAELERGPRPRTGGA